VPQRLQTLAASTKLNGIDFVEIADDAQTTLRVHFVNGVELKGSVTAAEISGGTSLPTVSVAAIVPADWTHDPDGRPLLTLRTAAPGDFSHYTLRLASPRLDPFYDHVRFSFKARCESRLDCLEREPHEPSAGGGPPIEYLAKDFVSFRQALSDFSALRYPDWQERAEADVAVMLMEALAAVADELSYTQDSVSTESTLDTATQRRSIVRHARMVDYEPRPTTSARVELSFEVTGGPLPAGVVVAAETPDGDTIEFETGVGLRDTATYRVDPRWNPLTPYVWDESVATLRRGTTEMWVHGHGLGLRAGQRLLIDTDGDPPLRQIVSLAPSAPGRADHATEEFDPLLGTPPVPITHLRWSRIDALTADHDLSAGRTTISGNVVPATQGRRVRDAFMIPAESVDGAVPATPANPTPRATVRVGPRHGDNEPARSCQYTLRQGRLTWLAGDGGVRPEILLERAPDPPASIAIPWTWRRWLLDAPALEHAFTVEPARYSPVGRTRGGLPVADYDGDGADTLRFGDSVFGRQPRANDRFTVTYRAGAGAAGNVAADAIRRLVTTRLPIASVTNPLPAAGGEDAESDERVRQLAPFAFRARQFRAVTRADYDVAAQTLSWVSRAGTAFRWTGSWLTVFVTADPRDAETIAAERHVELVELLNRYRLAGYEAYAPSPRYVSLDLDIELCAQPTAFAADVERAVLEALAPRDGFFDPDRFTFGIPLERSALEAAIDSVHGVAGVLTVRVRRRGVTAGFTELPDALRVARDQILRVDNDPSRPGDGSLRVTVKGGK
jgi:hypothetical protein